MNQSQPNDAQRRKPNDLLWPTVSILGGTGLLALFLLFNDWYFDAASLPLGSADILTPGTYVFSGMWVVLGTPAALLLAWGFSRLSSLGTIASLLTRLKPPRDWVWVTMVAAMAVTIPVCLREFVLGQAPLTDDEGAYEFMARLVASGRLYTQSPPLKGHFDTCFMVNDGKYYSNYFLGWPILLAPGVMIGIGKHTAAIYSGVLVVGLFLVVRRVAGVAWARLATILYLSSVLHMVVAATQLSHTACTMALIWLIWAVLRSRDQGAPVWCHALVAGLFSLAFLIRPLTAIGLGLPFLVQWLGHAWRLERSRPAALLWFGAVAASFMAGFLAIQWVQTGSPFLPPYQAYLKYAASNGFAFSPWNRGYGAAIANMSFEPLAMFAGLAATLYRINVEALGWPTLLVILLALGSTGSGAFWGSLGLYLLTNIGVVGAGIDSFGPIKFTEFSVVALVLVTIGFEQARRGIVWTVEKGGQQVPFRQGLPMALGVTFVLLSLIGYMPPRIATVARIAQAITLPQRTLAANDITSALVFTWPGWTPRCASKPTQHFVLRPPYPDPEFRAPILWVNHLTLEQDQKLRARYPDRPAFVLEWENCRPTFVPFESYLAAPGRLPPLDSVRKTNKGASSSRQ